jgi:DNA polymerase elongation subunit (family B)
MDFYTDVQVYGNNILLRGVRGTERYSKKVPYKPTLYVATQETDSGFKAMDGTNVSPMQFESIREARDFYKSYSDVANVTVYGNNLYNYAYINERWNGDIDFDSSLLRVANIDIEVASENGFPEPGPATEEVVSITVGIGGKYWVFGCGEFDNKTPDKVFYRKCQNEKELLLNFLDFWASDYPDVVTGWYIQLFDIPYLVNRITNLMGEKVANKLSPWGKIYERTFNQGYGNRVQAYEIVGVAEADYIILYQKFGGGSQESYKLNHIAWIELGEQKLDYSEHGALHLLYKNDYQKFIEYNIQDVVLVDRLDDKLGLIDLILSLAYLTKVNIPDVQKQVRMWDTITANHLLNRGIVVSPKKVYQKSDTYEGAYVKQPLIGEHKWVMSFDLASMYPMLIRQFNIGPETIQPEPMDINIEDIIYERVTEPLHDTFSVAGNGAMYTREFEGMLSTIMGEMYDGRVTAKNKMMDARKRKEEILKEIESRGLKT